MRIWRVVVEAHRVEWFNLGVPDIILELLQAREYLREARRPPRLALSRCHCRRLVRCLEAKHVPRTGASAWAVGRWMDVARSQGHSSRNGHHGGGRDVAGVVRRVKARQEDGNHGSEGPLLGMHAEW